MPGRASSADFPPVERILERIVAGLNDILGERLLGIYVYGSLVDGGFDAGVSDIDLVVALTHAVDDALFGALHGWQTALVTPNPEWRDRLELVYISADGLRNFRRRSSRIAVISPGEPFHILEAGEDWLISWYPLRETGLALQGPAVEALIEPIPLSDYLAALREHVKPYPALAATTPSKSWLSYIVLTVARALYTIRHGCATSKVEAANWAMRRYPRWARLLQDALRWRKDVACDDLTADQIRPCVCDYLRDMLPRFAD